MTMRRFLVTMLFVPLAAAAQAPEPLFNLVTLNAQAEREVPNDLLSATLAAEAEGADPAQLSAEINRTMQSALAVAKAYGAVRTRSGNYQTFPIYDKNRVSRWRVRQELRLESTEFAAATELIGKLQASLVVAGMTLSVSPESRRQAENALIPEALAAFEQRARLVREAMKAKGHRMRDLQISGGGSMYPVPFAAARSVSASASAPSPAIEAGITRILITVSGTIQLQ
jgi:predicted secreted protein